MTDAEFNAFVTRSTRALKRKQAGLAKQFGLGTYARWDYDQTTETLRFSDADGRVQVESTAVAIGSFSKSSQTWQWAWANKGTPAGPCAHSALIRGLFEATGIEVFRLEMIEADEDMAWEMAAMAVEHLSAAGCYRGESGQLLLFLAITSIRAIPVEA